MISFTSPLFLRFDSTQTYSCIPAEISKPPQVHDKWTPQAAAVAAVAVAAGQVLAYPTHSTVPVASVQQRTESPPSPPRYRRRRHQLGARGCPRHAMRGHRHRHSRSDLVRHRTFSAGDELFRDGSYAVGELNSTRDRSKGLSRWIMSE